MKRFSLLFVVAALWIGGCTSFEYAGQSFAPLPEEEQVAYFTGAGSYSADRYQVIGRGTLQVPNGYDGYDIKEYLLDEARKHGAGGVCVLSSQRVKVGVYPREGGAIAGPSDVNINPANINPDASPIEINAFGGTALPLTGEVHYRYEVVVNAQFLMERKKFDRLMELRRRQLQELTAPPPLAPAPAPAPAS